MSKPFNLIAATGNCNLIKGLLNNYVIFTPSIYSVEAKTFLQKDV